MVQAAKLGADQVNLHGGLVLRNEQAARQAGHRGRRGHAEAAVAAAQRLINQENVAAIVGPHWSREALPVSDLAGTPACR